MGTMKIPSQQLASSVMLVNGRTTQVPIVNVEDMLARWRSAQICLRLGRGVGIGVGVRWARKVEPKGRMQTQEQKRLNQL